MQSKIPSSRLVQSRGMKSIDPKQSRPSGFPSLSKKETQNKPQQQKATNIENQFRYALLRKGLNFIEQASIGPWSIDFYLPEHEIIIEADGEFWHNTIKAKMKDRRKDAWLKSKGYRVFHFTGKEIIENPNFCVEKITKAILTKEVIEEENNYDDLVSEEENREPNHYDDEYEQWLSGSSEFKSGTIG